jgi:hypothetical protein
MNKNEKQIIFWVGGFLLIVGVIIGIVFGYYALPHINYTITTQPGTYTFDIGPTAAGVFGEMYKPTNYTSITTKVVAQESIPVPNTNWQMSDGPRVLIGENGMPIPNPRNPENKCCYPIECYESIEIYANATCNRNCEYPIACYRQPTEEAILNRSIKFCKDVDFEPNSTVVDNLGTHTCVEWVRDVAIQSLIDEQ